MKATVSSRRCLLLFVILRNVCNTYATPIILDRLLIGQRFKSIRSQERREQRFEIDTHKVGRDTHACPSPKANQSKRSFLVFFPWGEITIGIKLQGIRKHTGQKMGAGNGIVDNSASRNGIAMKLECLGGSTRSRVQGGYKRSVSLSAHSNTVMRLSTSSVGSVPGGRSCSCSCRTRAR